MNPRIQISDVSVKVCFVGLPRQTVHARCRVSLQCVECRPQHSDADVVGERGLSARNGSPV